MSSVLCSQSVILGVAMAVSGAVILLSLGRQRIFSATHFPETQIPTSQNQSLRSCLSAGGRKKKKLRVRFADNVKAVDRKSRGEISSAVDRRRPDNRIALYHGILRDRVHVQRMQNVGSQRRVGRLLAPSSYGLLSRFSSDAGGKEVAVESADGKKKKKRLRSLLPGRLKCRRKDPRDDIVPSFNDIFEAGLGNALLEATQNINIGQMKEKDDIYKMRYEVPGLAKEYLKITIRDGVLNIVGEHKEEEGDESDDEFWSAKSYGFYNTSLVLPDNAKHDDIKAELKDGILTLVIPKDEKKAKQVKEVQIH